MGAGVDDAEGGEEAIWANNQAAISSTPTKPVAEVGFLRYGVRYSSTLPLLPVHYATSASFRIQTSIPRTPMPEGNKC